MSIEARVKQFYDEAVKGPSSKSLKEINTLRKFIHNNQNYDFHEKEKAKLFSTIELYFSHFDRKSNNDNDSNHDEESKKISALPLIEDALKVPLFTTKQKKSLLKWYEEILPESDKKQQQKKKQQEKNKYYSDDDDEEDQYNEDEDNEVDV
eukprot:gene2411-2978_t